MIISPSGTKKVPAYVDFSTLFLLMRTSLSIFDKNYIYMALDPFSPTFSGTGRNPSDYYDQTRLTEYLQGKSTGVGAGNKGAARERAYEMYTNYMNFQNEYDLWKIAAEYDAQLINYQLEYYSPQNQAALMRSAGFNPNLMGLSGNTSDVDFPEAGDMSAAPNSSESIQTAQRANAAFVQEMSQFVSASLQTAGQIYGTLNAARLARSQSELADKQSSYVISQRIGQDITNFLAMWEKGSIPFSRALGAKLTPGESFSTVLTDDLLSSYGFSPESFGLLRLVAASGINPESASDYFEGLVGYNTNEFQSRVTDASVNPYHPHSNKYNFSDFTKIYWKYQYNLSRAGLFSNQYNADFHEFLINNGGASIAGASQMAIDQYNRDYNTTLDGRAAALAVNQKSLFLQTQNKIFAATADFFSDLVASDDDFFNAFFMEYYHMLQRGTGYMSIGLQAGMKGIFDMMNNLLRIKLGKGKKLPIGGNKNNNKNNNSDALDVISSTIDSETMLDNTELF